VVRTKCGRGEGKDKRGVTAKNLSLKKEINPDEESAKKGHSRPNQLPPPLKEGRTEWELSVSRGGDRRRNDVGGGRCGY
jgi:hypothetical protein